MGSNGVVALAISPLLALLGIVVGKVVDSRRNRDDATGTLIKALQAEIDRRDRIDAERAATAAQQLDGAAARTRRLEDYCYALRDALAAAGLAVPGWPTEERTAA